MSNINDYVKPTDYGYVRKDINKILSLIHDLVAQEPEADGNKERIMFTPHVKLRTSSITIGSATWGTSEVKTREAFVWRRKKPESVNTYNLIHTQVGAGALTFPVDATFKGALVKTDGINYITIDDDTILSPLTEITIAVKLNLPASGGGFVLVEKMNEYRLRVVDTNILEFAVYSVGVYKTALTYSYTPSTSFSMVATYKSTTSGQKLYINGVLVSSDSETGAMVDSVNKLGIFATGVGASICPVNVKMAYLILLSTEAGSGWVTNYENYLYDSSDGNNEITCIAFVGDDRVTPNAETGLCKSS